MVGLARLRLRGAARCLGDEEDVALSAFYTFCRHAAEGRFPDLLDRDGLWRLLMVLTVRKAWRLLREVGQHVVVNGEEGLLEQVMSREPSPESAAEVAEEFRRLLGLLGDQELQAIAVARTESYGVEEIAARVGLAPRSVKRKLQLIRKLWEREVRS
jgi:DNA-directed RNA polymerase specialized sigma24 family protein